MKLKDLLIENIVEMTFIKALNKNSSVPLDYQHNSDGFAHFSEAGSTFKVTEFNSRFKQFKKENDVTITMDRAYNKGAIISSRNGKEKAIITLEDGNLVAKPIK